MNSEGETVVWVVGTTAGVLQVVPVEGLEADEGGAGSLVGQQQRAEAAQRAVRGRRALVGDGQRAGHLGRGRERWLDQVGAVSAVVL